MNNRDALPLNISLLLLQQLEAEQAEQKGRFSSAMADVHGRSLQLQQEVASSALQLQQEEAKALQLATSIASLQQKTSLLDKPAGVIQLSPRLHDSLSVTFSCMSCQSLMI